MQLFQKILLIHKNVEIEMSLLMREIKVHRGVVARGVCTHCIWNFNKR